MYICVTVQPFGFLAYRNGCPASVAGGDCSGMSKNTGYAHMRPAHNQNRLVARDFLSLVWFVSLATFDTLICKAQVQFPIKLICKLFASLYKGPTTFWVKWGNIS